MRRIALVFGIFALASGCGTTIDRLPDAGTTTAHDAGSTTMPDAGTTAEPDAGTTVEPDAGTTTAPDAGTIVTPDAGTTTTPDAGAIPTPDAGTPVSTVPGQCEVSGDCGGTLTCTQRPPGGFCAGCTDDGDCDRGDARTFTCNFGTCNQDCARDVDCPNGLHCHSTRFVCVLTSCGTCPAPYVCDNGFCVRRPCDAACPPARCHGGFCTDDF